jgi:hypothetical protein
MSLRAFVAKQHLHCVPAHTCPGGRCQGVSPVFKQYYGEFEPGDCFLTGCYAIVRKNAFLGTTLVTGDCFLTGCYAIVGENTLLGTTPVTGDCFARAAHKASMSVGPGGTRESPS